MPSLEEQKIRDDEERELVLTLILFMSIENKDQGLGTFNLVRVLGYESVLKLIAAFGGKTIHIPSFKELVASSNLVGAAMQVLKGSGEEEVVRAYRKQGIPITPHILSRIMAGVDRFRQHRDRVDSATESMGDELDRFKTVMSHA